MNRTLRWFWVAAALAVGLTACGGGGGDSGSAGSSPLPATVPPVLSASPQSVSVDDGGTVSFSVAASGGGTLRYQWSRNDQAIAGATSSSYISPVLSLADHQSSYRVTVSNEGGSVVSDAALLSVRAVAPSIGTQPASARVADGQAVGFMVHVKGSVPLNFQWLRNGQPIDGATQASYALDPSRMTDHGAVFSVLVRNVVGEARSESATLSVTPVAAAIANGPEAQTVVDGERVNFRAVARGSQPLAYQWLVDGQPIAGATTDSYSLTADYASSGKRFSVRVSNAWGEARSETALLTVTPLAPAVTQAQREVQLSVGQPARFSVTAGGTPPLRFQWERSDDDGASWEPIANATGTRFDVNESTLAWANARVRVVVRNVAGSVASSPVLLKVLAANRLLSGRKGGRGYADGFGSDVQFDRPGSPVFDAQGNLFVPDSENHVIRKISPDGQVSTWAGIPGGHGYKEGGPGVGRLNWPDAATIDAAGNLYVANSKNLFKVSPKREISRWAGGDQGEAGFVDGQGSAARFANILGLVSDAEGNLVVLDQNVVRRVSKSGLVSTVAGNQSRGYSWPQADGRGADVNFRSLRGVALSGDGSTYVCDLHAVRRLDADGNVSLFAGSYEETVRDVDGPRPQARFAACGSMGFDATGRLYLVAGNALRTIEPDGATRTLVRGDTGNERDGAGSEVGWLGNVRGIAVSPDGKRIVYSSISNGESLRELSPAAGSLRTLAGHLYGEHHPSSSSAAAFLDIRALATNSASSLLVSIGGNLRTPVLRVHADGRVSNAGPPLLHLPDYGSSGPAVLDHLGGAYVVDVGWRRILYITPTGQISTFAGPTFQSNDLEKRDGPLASATFGFIYAIALASDGALYVAESDVIRRIANGQVSTIAGQRGKRGHADGDRAVSLLCAPVGLAIDLQGALLVADDCAHVIRRVSPDGITSTVAGAPGVFGHRDGSDALFFSPNGVAVGPDGSIYVSDGRNAMIRRVSPKGFVTTVMGTGEQTLQANKLGGAINRPKAVVVLPSGRLAVATEWALIGD